MARTISIILAFVLAGYFAPALSTSLQDGRQTLSIRRKTRPHHYRPEVGAIGLGDQNDQSYLVDIDVGDQKFPVTLDTGSSDMWVISTECGSTNCGVIKSAPEVDISKFNDSGQDIFFLYGISSEVSVASGRIVTGPVGIAGLSPVYNQTFGAVNATNTSLPSIGSSGLLGLGFPNPDSSDLIRTLVVAALGGEDAAFNLTGPERTNFFLANIKSFAPLVPAMILDGILKEPMFALTLQRESILPGGNIGELTIGGLPDRFSSETLTWAPVRLYDAEEGGLDSPLNGPKETFPLFWEIPLDDVYLNGVKLPKPTLPQNVTYTAVIDSGTSGIIAPPDVLEVMLKMIGIGGNSTFANISCSKAVDLTFIISGQELKVDPLDILGGQDSDQHCNSSTFVAGDPPSTGELFSWIFGDTVMKSALFAFYYGNITSPSVDPPRIGFYSTVPSNANKVFSSAIAAALSTDSVSFIDTTVTAPTGTFSATATNSDGVAQNPTGTCCTVPYITTWVPTYSNAASNAELKNDLVNDAATSSSDGDVQKLLKYAPIVLGLVAVTTILAFISVIFSIVSLCKRRSGLGPTGTPSASYRSAKSLAGDVYRDAEGHRDDTEPMLG